MAKLSHHDYNYMLINAKDIELLFDQSNEDKTFFQRPKSSNKYYDFFVIIIDKIVCLHMLLDIIEVMPLKLNNYSREQKNFTYN